MIKLIGAVFGAFFLFILVFPLAGLLFTLILKILLPYFIVPTVLAILVKHNLAVDDATSIILTCSVVWVALVQLARRAIKNRKLCLPWHEGHYQGALLVLSLGIPLWTGKIAIEEEIEELLSEVDMAKTPQLQTSASE